MPAKYLYNRKMQIASMIILAIIFIVLSIQTFGRAYREVGYDFTSYLLSSQAFWNGENPYLTQTPYPYIYPLFLAVVLIPFVYLPPFLSDSIFLAVNILLLSYSFLIVAKYFAREKIELPAFALPSLIVSVFFLGIIQNNLLNGQINIVVLFFTIIFFIYYLKEKPVLSSLFLSLAVSIKLTPLIFLFFLLRRKKYKIILLTLFFSFILIFGLPYLLQPGNTIDAYQVYFQKLKDLSLSETLNEKSKIFTLYDFISYLIPYLKENTLFKILSAAAVILVLLLLDKTNPVSGNRQKEILIFSIYSSAILLISPMSETHHIIVILPAISVLAYLLFFDYKKFSKTSIIILTGFTITFLLSTLFKVGIFYFISFSILISLIYIFYKSDYGKQS